MAFFNEAGEVRRAYYLNPLGLREFMFELGPGGSETGWQTFVGDLWVITDAQDMCVAILEAADEVDGMDHEITFH